jgi:hypothetical protein
MNKLDRIRVSACAAGLGLSALFLSPAFGSGGGPRMTEAPTGNPEAEPAFPEKNVPCEAPEAAIAGWPRAARLTARSMISEYGAPNRCSKDALAWLDNGPWKMTVVNRSGWPLFGIATKDYVEQTLAYRVPADRVEDLKRFDSRLEVNQLGRLSVRSESESMNFLALNVANDIVMDKRGVQDARDFYRRAVRLAHAGKSSAYTKGLLFRTGSAARRP